MTLSHTADANRQRLRYNNMTSTRKSHKLSLQAQSRAQMTAEQRAHQSALRAQRRAHRLRQSTQTHWWTTLQSAQAKSSVQTWLPPCQYCGVRRLASESVDFCCQKDKILAPPLAPLPSEIQSLVDKYPAKFALLSWKLNNLFCLTVMGVSGGFQKFSGAGPQTVTISGQIFRIFLTPLKLNCLLTHVEM
jgi:hypothetical protein